MKVKQGWWAETASSDGPKRPKPGSGWPKPRPGQDAAGRKQKGKEWFRKVKEACPEVKWKLHYALLGAYDFMDVYDAPDMATAHKVSLISRTHGALTAESWQALPYDDYLGLLGELDP